MLSLPAMTRRRSCRPLTTASCLIALAAACGHDDSLPTRDEIGFVHQAATCENGGDVEPDTPTFGPAIDDYASYDGQTSCISTASEGTKAFRDLVLKTYPCTTSGGIVRSCSAGGTSEHKEGRAWDWMLDYPHPAADALLEWLLATDEHGNQHAMARRLGVMYMIWNSKIWKAYQPAAGWQPYSGASPHTDHVHFSFSWASADQQTSFWTAATTNPPPPPPPPPPTPPPGPTPDPCAPSCDGGSAVAADCSTDDCAVRGLACVESALGASCVDPACVTDPASAPVAHDVCLDQGEIGSCDGHGLLAESHSCPAGTLCVQTAGGAICDVATTGAGTEPEQPTAGIAPGAGVEPVGSGPEALPGPLAETRPAGHPGGTLYGVGCAVAVATATKPSGELAPALCLLALASLLRRRRRR